MTVRKNDREDVPALTRFRDLAKELDEEATRVAANVITKHYRFVIGVQMANAADALAELADESFEHYPSSMLAAYDRRKCYSKAISKAKTVKRQANKARRLRIAKPEAFKTLIEDADEFINIARGLKKSVKVKGVESIEDAREWLLAQLDALDAMQNEEEEPQQTEGINPEQHDDPNDVQSGNVALC